MFTSHEVCTSTIQATDVFSINKSNAGKHRNDLAEVSGNLFPL